MTGEGVTHVPAAPVVAIVKEWLTRCYPEAPQAGLEAIAAAIGVGETRVRSALDDDRRWGPQVSAGFDRSLMTFALADRLLTAVGETHQWQETLAEYAPAAYAGPLSNKVRLPGEKGRVKRLSRGCLLTRAQIEAIHKLHIDGGLSLREIARRGWQTWGYASMHSAVNCVCELLKLEGLETRDRIEATRLATTKHGKSRRGAKCPKHRRQLRLRSGEIRGVRCSAIKTRYGRGRGERCQLAALRDSEWCYGHDPRRAEQRRAHLDAARKRRDALKAAAA